MDTLTIILATVALLAFVALAFMSGYELGTTNGIDTERALANKRVNGLLADLNNTRRPKAAKNRRKAQRKAVRV
jgi:hypothetical protein